MLTPKLQLNLRHVLEYFDEHLSMGDYYAEGQAVTGNGSVGLPKGSCSKARSAKRCFWPWSMW